MTSLLYLPEFWLNKNTSYFDFLDNDNELVSKFKNVSVHEVMPGWHHSKKLSGVIISPQLKVLLFERAGPEQKQPAGLGSEAALCCTAKSSLYCGNSQVRSQ
ncbi:hypothetical protein GOODEAATRI_032165 [Goodea atripinnis]|uniref:Uncharacterized protein n=1 Tax=Goodea atripinnis TaxID=208336 RepID=A0ABV0NPV2_9TELE